jgi:hypothetical protein
MNTIANMLAALFALATAIVVFLGARATLMATRKVDTRVEHVEVGVHDIHQAVNSRLDAMLARQELMISAMEKAGLTVPPPVPLPELGGSSDHA